MKIFHPTPEVCTICEHPFEPARGTPMYVAVVFSKKQSLCKHCFKIFEGIVEGEGQKFKRRSDGNFEKETLDAM